MDKIINFNKTVYELAKNTPEVADILAQVGFKEILRPGMLASVGRFMTIPKGAALRKIDIKLVKQAFIDNGYKIVE